MTRVAQGVAVMLMAMGGGPLGLVSGYLGFYLVHGTANVVHYGMVHRLVDADHRTTVVSANSLASRLGGTAGAVGLGVLAGGAGIPVALAVAAGALAAGAPCTAWPAGSATTRRCRRAARRCRVTRPSGSGSKATMSDHTDDEPFDALVASANAAMVVVTTAAGAQRAGCLVGFHGQTSIEPRRYGVWLSKANHTYRVALLAGHLAVHFLTDADRDLAELFGAVSGDDVDKFASCGWAPGPHGVPLLHRCPNRLVVARTTLLDDGGDHVAVSGRPIAAHSAGEFAPLRFADVRHLHPGHEADERPGSVPEHGRRGS